MPASGDTTDSRQAKGLLEALANFVRPIVYECLSSDTIVDETKQGRSTSVKSADIQLLDCLKALIAETVDDYRTKKLFMLPSSSTPHVSSASALVPQTSEPVKGARHHSIPAKFEDVFKRDVSNRLRSAVSKLPTRLLAFDATGSDIHLVDHRELVQFLADIISKNIHDTDFLPDLVRLLEKDPTGDILRYTPWVNITMTGLIDTYTQYSILSHTWTKDLSGEILYQNWGTRAQNPRGFEKVKRFCRVSAQIHGNYLGWIDTCCINKDSSAELDEAIRSMYKWYRHAAQCIVYLSETRSMDKITEDSWFTRGWTLQELVAPKKVVIYDMQWQYTTCDDETLTAAAGITSQEWRLFRYGDKDEIPLSRRLRMACGRHVTREEDTAYSLMGLLGVSISTAYGEGATSAFTRLMRELINTKRNVMDLFNHGYSNVSRSVIPSTVEVYRDRSTAFDYISQLNNVIPIEPFLPTHVGLRMRLLLLPGFRNYWSEGKFIPKADLYGRVWDFDLLDSSIYYSSKLPLSSIAFFGIVNFSLDNGWVKIGNPCISIPLDCGGQYPGHIESTDKIKTLSFQIDTPPPVFTLRSLKDGNKNGAGIKIHQSALEHNGLQHIMLYL